MGVSIALRLRRRLRDARHGRGRRDRHVGIGSPLGDDVIAYALPGPAAAPPARIHGIR
jgi:hypothetical protein